MTIPSPDPVLIERFRRDVEVIAAQVGQARPVGVAVSGGADSLALLLLGAAAYPGAVHAISVDHGLRPAAAGECSFVAEVCRQLDVPHDTISVVVRPNGKGPQAAAREARHTAFASWGREKELGWIMTAHHVDDQAETVLMRLAMGAGVGGLAAVRPTNMLPGDGISQEGRLTPDLLRPLLGWRRRELAAIVSAAGLVPVDDPSNSDPRYNRTRFRALLAGTSLIDARRVGMSAANCHDADLALEDAAHAKWVAAMDWDGTTARLALGPWRREIMRRVLNLTLKQCGVRELPRSDQLARLIGRLEAGRTTTLAGIKVVPREGVWIFTKAPPRGAN